MSTTTASPTESSATLMAPTSSSSAPVLQVPPLLTLSARYIFKTKSLVSSQIFFFSYEILFLTVTCNLNNCNLYLSNLRILESVYLSCLLHKLYIILLLFLAKKSVMKFWSGGCVWKQMTQVQFSWEKNCLVWEVGL